MVVKKKTAKVEAVVLDEENLHKLIGKPSSVMMCIDMQILYACTGVCTFHYMICVYLCVLVFLSIPLCGWRRRWSQAGGPDPSVLFGADRASAADPAG